VDLSGGEVIGDVERLEVRLARAETQLAIALEAGDALAIAVRESSTDSDEVRLTFEAWLEMRDEVRT
jgi:hypothetical protein